MLCPNCGNQTPLYKKTCINCNYDLGKISVEDLLSDVSLDTLEQELDSISSERGLSIGDRVADRYQIKALIGRGSFGAAYRAQDLQQGDHAVVKVLHEKFFRSGDSNVKTSLLDSLTKARELSHPNIVAIRDVVEEQGLIHIVSDHEVALPLTKLIRAREAKASAFSLEYVLELFEQVYRALAYAHASTFHGNLTPDNVMVRKESVKIADFGVAAGILPNIPTQITSTFKGQSYRGPETLEAPERLGPISDVYSCGSILYRMLNLTRLGEVPEYTLEFDDRYPSAIKQVIAKATEPTPADRYPDVEAFFSSLANVVAASRPAPAAAPEVEASVESIAEALDEADIEPVDVFAQDGADAPVVADEDEQIDVFADESDAGDAEEPAVHFGSIATGAARRPSAPEPEEDLLPDLDPEPRLSREPEFEAVTESVDESDRLGGAEADEPRSELLAEPEPEFIPAADSDPDAAPVPDPEPGPGGEEDLPMPPEPTAVESDEPEPEPETVSGPEPESPFVDPGLPADARPKPATPPRRSVWSVALALFLVLAIAGGGLYFLFTYVLHGMGHAPEVGVVAAPPVATPPTPAPEPAPELAPEPEPVVPTPEPAPSETPPAPPSGPTDAERAAVLIAEGDGFLDRNRLMAPTGDNAVARYRAALELVPGNINAKRGLSHVGERYVELGDRARDGGGFDRAEGYYKKALAIDETSAGRQRLDDLDRRRRDASGPAAPVAPPTPARPETPPPAPAPEPAEETVNLLETVDLHKTGNLEEEISAARPESDELVNLTNISPPPAEPPAPPAEEPPAGSDAGAGSRTDTKGTVDIDEVKAVIKSYMGRIKICYKTGLEQNPDMKGEVKVLFTIGSDGHVKSTRIAESTLNDPEVENCILRRFRRMQFPEPAGGEVTIKYPLVFRE